MPRMTFAEARARAEADTRTLGQCLLAWARRGPRRTAVIDPRGAISRIRLAAVALAVEPLLGLADDEARVGVVLPPGQGGTLVNAALALAGRTAVNLNHTTGEAQLAQMCRLAGLRTIVSSRVYLERIGSPRLPGRVVVAEDLIPRLGKARVASHMLRVLALPPARIDRARPDDAAVVVFSSGSTGEPKGVQLTHRQVLANCDAVVAHLDLRPGVDSVTSPLPLFHAFGVLPGLWLPLVNGCLVASQPDPRDAVALGKLAARARTTFLISTPTFVRTYLRRIAPEQLAHLRFAVVGAERCPQDLKDAFKARYGADLLEGYGATELGPAVSVNRPGHVREGSVGQPLPGVEVFTMHPDTRQILPPGEAGLIVVRSAARMSGYLDRPDLTAQALIHDGYDTGDIGRVDADGHVHLTGRLARFAKVGGEMVPLDNVEAALQAWVEARHGEAYHVAVGAAPSATRGEKIVVLHTGVPDDPEVMLDALAGLPPIFRPKRPDFHVVDAIPTLGTGKRDLGGIRKLAEALSAAADQPSAVQDLHAHAP